ncbi:MULTISPECIES: 23S rRNA (uracil(1939)-C(5))-methyltransferase RlmD [unclassified Granulicatella]|uniref:23S rRNA (uracil(1939)-C(5))-methyltransferase RlmD n=1 Tax=unclassified Granulicatella TaxID=2630493 RepID=UPI001074767C|nr:MULTISPECIES: 23S rRNA (uracil(1939)-C(5))-methyltransferase RlmD [unclassified Granulicatella]MBF0780318.1 23S rRNA (uracil(1939)-C(5))-methyltransferase RlmD [Granulicatella sp. 19428wC4_WM01]TFU95545.1 23S rRNA (uracil(1939)-C(5))-methyltransferase RlmD [Granulicatella sp. WM01]
MQHIKKNEEYIVECIDLTYEGLGVAKIEGYPIFIDNFLPTEQARIKLIKVSKTYGVGKMIELLISSTQRVPICDKVGTWVGTMPLQHLAYSAQLEFKQNQVKHVMQHIAKMPHVPVKNTLAALKTTQYRNKAQIPVREIDGQLTTGFFRKNTHQLIPIENFVIQDPIIDEVILMVRNVLRRFNLSAYNEEKHTGDIRHIIVRRARVNGEIQIVLVTRTHKPIPFEIVQEIVSHDFHIVSIVQNINDARTNVIMGNSTKILFNEDKIYDYLLRLKFGISSRSFYQVNPEQTEVLYQQAIDAANIQKSDIVIDAYCGIGTIGLCVAKQAKHVYGVEVVPDAIVMAKENAILNGITNVTFEVGQAEDVMVKWEKSGIKADVLIVDPPRKGLDKQFIHAALAISPAKIVYISCNPATLARDLVFFADGGYSVQFVQPVDLFPQTTHVECVVLLQRSKE